MLRSIIFVSGDTLAANEAPPFAVRSYRGGAGGCMATEAGRRITRRSACAAPSAAAETGRIAASA